MSTSFNQKILVILGPTASGKSDLAVRLAKRLNGEVISADSRQVYKGLNVGTGKITHREMKGIKHHLLNVVNPKRQFSVQQYQKLANKAIQDILSRNKLPIICGGTGFYIEAVINGASFPPVKADAKLRKKLSHKSAAQLLSIYKELDTKKALALNGSDRHNPRRLIRAIEIARSPAIIRSDHKKPAYDATYIGLNPPRDELKKRIHGRLIARMKKGMVAEVGRLHKKGLSWKRLDELGLEYRYVALFLQGKMSKKEMLATLEIRIGQYAKRQMTWFRKNKEIRWAWLADSFVDNKHKSRYK